MAAAHGEARPFEGKGDPAFDGIRTLFPSLTMHFVMDAAKKAKAVTSLLNAGRLGAAEREKYFGLLGLNDSVTVSAVELSNAVVVFMNGQINCFVTCGRWPAPNVIETSVTMTASILSMSDDEVAETGRSWIGMPEGTYAEQDAAIFGHGFDIVVYQTKKMYDDRTSLLTKAPWEEQTRLADVSPEMLKAVATKIHPGALHYYAETATDLGTVY